MSLDPARLGFGHTPSVTRPSFPYVPGLPGLAGLTAPTHGPDPLSHSSAPGAVAVSTQYPHGDVLPQSIQLHASGTSSYGLAGGLYHPYYPYLHGAQLADMAAHQQVSNSMLGLYSQPIYHRIYDLQRDGLTVNSEQLAKQSFQVEIPKQEANPTAFSGPASPQHGYKKGDNVSVKVEKGSSEKKKGSAVISPSYKTEGHSQTRTGSDHHGRKKSQSTDGTVEGSGPVETGNKNQASQQAQHGENGEEHKFTSTLEHLVNTNEVVSEIQCVPSKKEGSESNMEDLNMDDSKGTRHHQTGRRFNKSSAVELPDRPTKGQCVRAACYPHTKSDHGKLAKDKLTGIKRESRDVKLKTVCKSGQASQDKVSKQSGVTKGCAKLEDQSSGVSVTSSAMLNKAVDRSQIQTVAAQFDWTRVPARRKCEAPKSPSSFALTARLGKEDHSNTGYPTPSEAVLVIDSGGRGPVHGRTVRSGSMHDGNMYRNSHLSKSNDLVKSTQFGAGSKTEVPKIGNGVLINRAGRRKDGQMGSHRDVDMEGKTRGHQACVAGSLAEDVQPSRPRMAVVNKTSPPLGALCYSQTSSAALTTSAGSTQTHQITASSNSTDVYRPGSGRMAGLTQDGQGYVIKAEGHGHIRFSGSGNKHAVSVQGGASQTCSVTATTCTNTAWPVKTTCSQQAVWHQGASTTTPMLVPSGYILPYPESVQGPSNHSVTTLATQPGSEPVSNAPVVTPSTDDENNNRSERVSSNPTADTKPVVNNMECPMLNTSTAINNSMKLSTQLVWSSQGHHSVAQSQIAVLSTGYTINTSSASVGGVGVTARDVERECMSGDHASVSSGGDMVQHEDTKPVLHSGCTTNSTNTQSLEVKGAIVTQTEETPFSQGTGIPVGIAVARQRQGKLNSSDGGCSKLDPDDRKVTPRPGMSLETAGGEAITEAPTLPGNMVGVSAASTRRDIPAGKNCTSLGSNLIVTGGDTGRPGLGAIGNHDGSLRAVMQSPWLQAGQVANSGMLWTGSQTGSHSSLEQGHTAPVGVPLGFKVVQDPLSRQCFLVPEVTGDGGRGWLATLPNTQQLQLIAQHCAQNEQEREQNQQLQQYWEYMLNLQRCYSHTLQVTTAPVQSTSQGSMLSTAATSMPCAVTAAITSPVKPDLSSPPSTMHSCNSHRQTHSQLSAPGLAVFPVGPLGQAAYPYVPTQQFPYIVDNHGSQVAVPHTSTTTMVTPVTTAVMTISRGTSPIQVALPDNHVSEQADAAVQNCLSPDMETCRARLPQIEVKDTFVQTEVTNGYREQEESKVVSKSRNSFLCERCHVLCTEESNNDKSPGPPQPGGEKTVHDVKAKVPVSSATDTGTEQAVCQTENKINTSKANCEAVDLRTKVSCEGTQSKSLNQGSHPESTTQTKDQIVESIYRDLDPGSLTSADGLELLSLLAERKSLEWKEELKQKQISVKTTVKPAVKSHCKRTGENKVAPESRIARVLSWKSDNSSDSANGGLLGSPVPKPHPDSDTCIDPQELDVRMKMAEIQRKYREHQRRLARLQPKKQEKGKKEKKVSRRRPGRPPKKKVATYKQPSPQKSSSEEKTPVKEVKPPAPVETPEKKDVCEIKPVTPVKVDVIPAEPPKKEVKVVESPPKEEKITPKVEVKPIPFKYESKGPLMLAKCSMPPPMVLSRKLKAALWKSAEAVKKKAKAEKCQDSKTKGDSKKSVSKIKDKLKDSHKRREGSSKKHLAFGSPEKVHIKHEKKESPVGVSERHSNETSPAKMNLSSPTKDTWQKTAVSKVTATETTNKPEATVSVLAKYGVDQFSTTTSIAAATSAALKSKDSKKRKKMLQENGYDLSDWQDYPGVKRRKPGRPRKLGDSPSRVTETIVSKKSGVSPLSSGSPVKPQPVVKQSPKVKPEPLDDLMFCRRSERIFLNNPAIVSPTPAKVSSDTKPKTLHKPAKATTSAQSLSQKLKKKYANKHLPRNTVLKNRSVSAPVPAKRIVKVEPERNESDVSEADDVPLSNLVDKPEITDDGPCKVTKENLKEGLRVLMYREGLFYEGKVKAIQPPDVYGVVIDGERGSRPHVYSREQLLQEIVLDVKPESMQDLPEGTRVCAYWSELFSCLYPGTIARASPNPYTDVPLVYVEFDDGDSGKIPLDHTRLLPQDFTVDDFEHSDRLDSTGKKRRRTISGELSVENIERKPSISDTLTGYLLSPAKLELTKKRGPGRPPKHASSPRDQRKSIDNSSLGAYIRNTNTERKKQDLSSTSFPSDQNMKKNVGKSVKGLTPDKSGRRASESSVRKSKKDMVSSSEDSDYDDDDDDDGVMLRRRAGSDEEEASSDDEYDDISQMFEGKGKLAAVRKRATAGFLTARQLWEWQGKSTKRPGMKGKAKKEFYKAVIRGKETIKVGECAVFLSNNRPNLPFVGRIESMWEGWGGNMVVKVKWFYHPEETKGVRKMNLTKGALFRSPHSDENDVQTISHRCEVLSYKQFLSYKAKKQQNDGKVDPNDPLADCKDIFYLAGSYDPGLGIVNMETGLG